MPLYTGVSGANREVKKLYTGVGGTNKEVKEMYTGVNGTNRKIFQLVNPIVIFDGSFQNVEGFTRISDTYTSGNQLFSESWAYLASVGDSTLYANSLYNAYGNVERGAMTFSLPTATINKFQKMRVTAWNEVNANSYELRLFMGNTHSYAINYTYGKEYRKTLSMAYRTYGYFDFVFSEQPTISSSAVIGDRTTFILYSDNSGPWITSVELM